MKVLLLENIHPIAKSNLENWGIEVDVKTTALNEDELITELKNYDALGVRSKTQVTTKVLEQSSHLSAVCCFCIGTNQVDLATANKLGIPVFNAPYANTRSVAELVIGEVICLARKVAYISMLAHQGKWQKSATQSHEIRAKTLGLIGYGHIGSQVSVLAESMGMNVSYFDIIKKLPLGNSTACDNLDELLSSCDFISLHVPETPETRNMIGTKEIKKMKPGSYLINASRGSVVDIDALAEGIKSKHLAGAAVDVFPAEPKNNQEVFTSGLQGLENMILTPHIGGSTEEAQEAIGIEVSKSIQGFLKEGFTGGAVNFPLIECYPPKPEIRRLINIHKNVPGVIKEISEIVSQMGANIIGQHLATDSNIGYLVMDVEAVYGDELTDKIRDLKNSIKTRSV